MEVNIDCFMALVYALERANQGNREEAAAMLKELQARNQLSDDFVENTIADIWNPKNRIRNSIKE